MKNQRQHPVRPGDGQWPIRQSIRFQYRQPAAATAIIEQGVDDVATVFRVQKKWLLHDDALAVVEALRGPRTRGNAGIADMPPAAPDLLTERDREVLRLIAGGLSNREIARIRNLAEGTVKNRVSDILVKLGCRDRTQAVLYAIHWRLL